MSYPDAMPVVWVRWIDSHSHNGWKPAKTYHAEIDDPADNSLECQTVGWLYHERATTVTIAQSQSAEQHVADLMEIPRAVIREMRVLVPADQDLHAVGHLWQEEGNACDLAPPVSVPAGGSQRYGQAEAQRLVSRDGRGICGRPEPERVAGEGP